MKYFLKVIKKYAEFKGRARRKEYWMYRLFFLLFSIPIMFVDIALNLTFGDLFYGPFYTVFMLALILPDLGVTIRRLHDIGKSGWWIFIAAIPVIGIVWFLILMTTDSAPGENKYGSNPKDGTLAEADKDSTLASNNDASPIGDNLILMIVIWMLISSTLYTLSPFIMERYGISNTDWYAKISFLSIVGAFIPIGLAFTVKNKSKQLVVFILGVLFLLFQSYPYILELFR